MRFWPVSAWNTAAASCVRATRRASLQVIRPRFPIQACNLVRQALSRCWKFRSGTPYPASFTASAPAKGAEARPTWLPIPLAAAGELNLGLTPHDAPENVLANRAALAQAVLDRAEAGRSTPASLIALQQIHSGLTYRVDRSWTLPNAITKEDANSETVTLPRGDGLMTNQPGVLLAVQTADCIPVLVVDRKRRAVAAFHAGWRGTLKRIVEGGIGRMRLEFGSEPEDLEAAIGPGVGSCCYAVGDEVRSEFESQFSYAHALFSEVYDSDPIKEKYPLLFMTARAPGHSNIGPSLHLDLAEANRRQLLDAGLRPEAIHGGDICTSCNTERYFSYRAERGFCGRMMSVIGLTE